MPKIIIGVPVYNGAAYLERCLACLTAQDCGDLGILISDNASTDATPEIIARFAAGDPRISVIRQPVTTDSITNFVAVREAADCRYFAWRAHDDWSAPDWAGKLGALLDFNPDAALAVSRVLYVEADGRIAADRRFPEALGAGDMARVRLARQMVASWFYGLYRKDRMSRHFDHVRAAFPHTWAHDYALLITFALEGALVGTNATSFHGQFPGTSARYRPTEWRAAWRHYADFIAVAHAAAQAGGLSPLARLRLDLALPGIAGGHIEKLRRIGRGWLSERLGGNGATRRPVSG